MSELPIAFDPQALALTGRRGHAGHAIMTAGYVTCSIRRSSTNCATAIGESRTTIRAGGGNKEIACSR